MKNVSYIEFALTAATRIEHLQRVIAALAVAKRGNSWPDDEYWEAYFDPASRSYFWSPTQAEADEALRQWRENPNTPLRWDFGSLLDAFRNGEYNLIGCVPVDQKKARLEFETYAHPYGGTGCMVALIEAFGGQLVGEHGT